jgi:L-seryl-tRNA(Ser) seleniumtransferase
LSDIDRAAYSNCYARSVRQPESRRAIPSIDRVRQRPAVAALEAQYGQATVLEALRAAAERVRATLASGDMPLDAADEIERIATAHLSRTMTGSLRAVINATGVILHTNLGRAPLSQAAAERVARLASGYTTLEYDLEAGARGRRDIHAEALLCRLTGAEAAVVVNNNAAATLLTLAALARGREVIVSRGELVEIGGGFRVPDVMAQSGAVLREVGTTNRTRAADYAAAIGERTAAILRVHPSNFRIEGFTERPRLEELIALGSRFRIPVIEDLGSGHLGSGLLGSGLPAGDLPGLRDEPRVTDSVRSGAGVVMFSGDKLLGGPQAGIIVGQRELLDPVRKHPLMRAFRVDKMTYAALEATLLAYAAGRPEEIPVIRMITATADEIGRRASRIAEGISGAFTTSVVDGSSTIGGGSAPGSTLPTRLLRLSHASLSPDALAERLRALDPPIIARIEDGFVVLDLRTVAEEQDVAVGLLLAQL